MYAIFSSVENKITVGIRYEGVRLAGNDYFRYWTI